MRSTALAAFTAGQLSDELKARGERASCPFPCHEGQERALDARALEHARALLAAGDLTEAAIWLGRAHPHLTRLPDLVERALRSKA
ncbi:hypothetical protein [Methylobacterium gnaphalii]|uniref:Uncharacterized protein n=1 Tax=Methylobacterium gnaphalii TaxID=1010610 RepID=A0A512JPB3_9HYPH|nr:hypothetical protein [Methylobacterium gnaphalii]GEP11791.1 hypothetical protein MGN01_36360 [Methylobacterium gnaphalii]GJD69468.1 hypothetical protein MMMDOFMJ_2399 [Methylobacterium gnaphalii]GLS49574.1 hypothetical protein GCM10007885_24230 [Methylobacterium gnaphalii]